MNRTEHATQIITAGAFKDFTVRETCEPSWLVRFPYGFTPIPRTMEGEFFDICPARIVEASATLTDEEFTAFCHAISVWQNQSMMDFAMQLPADLVVSAFADRYPEQIAILLTVADQHRTPLVEFLGARQVQR